MWYYFEIYYTIIDLQLTKQVMIVNLNLPVNIHYSYWCQSDKKSLGTMLIKQLKMLRN